MKKQMTYADNNNIPFVAMIGENERKENKVMLKDMKSGDQATYSTEEFIATLTDAIELPWYTSLDNLSTRFFGS